eukprot:CAMPEP_0174335028 /NCGR_PEP_ID=MMETSP0810-20121108/20416_1 /TAXON_ID=73025 ORGANISM="Eutreptiella gymnastica-like, Strain CCMP1594" /NCGR_SAMPLE_ID=MMETSP0810 /ASSEMBLY_ACC=CAM_ASM_000659 /LENGTH=41 /DNA_ID= /DNA_START= /DNA_END= /DNA_ORIENTATION=
MNQCTIRQLIRDVGAMKFLAAFFVVGSEAVHVPQDADFTPG